MKISEIWGGNVLSLQEVLFGYEDQPEKKIITFKSEYRDHLCGVQEHQNLAALICVKSNKILYQQLSLSDDDQMNY